MQAQNHSAKCSACGMPIQPGTLRCPRCNQLLISLDGCGSCQGCSLAGICHPPALKDKKRK